MSNVKIHKEIILIQEEYRVLVNKKDLKLSIKEYLILEMLILNPYKLFNTDEIFNKCWPECSDSMLETVKVHICKIRKKIKKHTNYPYLRTVRCIGYSLDVSDLNYHDID